MSVMIPHPNPWLSVALMPFFWVIALYTLAVIDGWTSLSGAYRTDSLPQDGFLWRGQSARFRFGTNYSGCLNIAADSRGRVAAGSGEPQAVSPPQGAEQR